MDKNTFFCFRLEGMQEDQQKALKGIVGEDIVLLDRDTISYHISRMVAANNKYNTDLSIRQALEESDENIDITSKVNSIRELVSDQEFGYSQVTKALECDFPVAKQLMKLLEAIGLVKSDSKGRFRLFNDTEMQKLYLENKIKSLEESVIANKQLLTLIENQ